MRDSKIIPPGIDKGQSSRIRVILMFLSSVLCEVFFPLLQSSVIFNTFIYWSKLYPGCFTVSLYWYPLVSSLSKGRPPKKFQTSVSKITFYDHYSTDRVTNLEYVRDYVINVLWESDLNMNITVSK